MTLNETARQDTLERQLNEPCSSHTSQPKSTYPIWPTKLLLLENQHAPKYLPPYPQTFTEPSFFHYKWLVSSLIKERMVMAEKRRQWIFSITVFKPTAKKRNTCKYSTMCNSDPCCLKLVRPECHNEKLFKHIRIGLILSFLIFYPKI